MYQALFFFLSLAKEAKKQKKKTPDLRLVRSLQSALRSLRFTLTSFFKTLSIGPAPEIEPLDLPLCSQGLYRLS